MEITTDWNKYFYTVQLYYAAFFVVAETPWNQLLSIV